MSTQIQIRRGTAAAWTAANPILAQGEMGIETDTSKFKFGDGVTAWASLAYILTGAGVSFTPTGTIAATTVQAAIAEVSTDVADHLGDTTDAHDASAISVLDTAAQWTGANVETVLAELPSKLAPLVTQGRTWLAVGDSILNGSSASNSDYSFWPQACRIASGFVTSRVGIRYGTPGETSTAIAARCAANLDANTDVGGLVIECGSNDATTSVPVDTFAANIVTMVGLARARRLPVVVLTIIPRGSGASAAITASTLAYNVWIRSNAKKYGYTVADCAKPFADTTSGLLLATYDSGDGVHPNTVGHSEMAMIVAQAMIIASGVPTPRGLVQEISALNLFTNELFLAGSTLPTGWTEHAGGTGTAPTYSLVADTYDVLPAGRWAQAHIAAGADTVRRFKSPTITVTAGNVMIFTCHLQVEDISGDFVDKTSTNDSHAVLNVLNAGTVVSFPLDTPTSRTVGIRRPDAPTVYDYGPMVWGVTVPVGATSAMMWLQMKVKSGSEYKYRLGCPGAFDATANGLTDYLTWV